MDYYEVLEVSHLSDYATIKRQFQTLARMHHPDKLSKDMSSDERQLSVQRFHKIEQAWRVLSDEKARAEYDAARDQQLNQPMPVGEDVDLDDMEYDAEDKSYYSGCRCGGEYIVSEEELEAEVTLVCCTNCTLCIRLLYHRAPS